MTGHASRPMPTYSGLFNTASPLLCGTAKLIYTWNARALICVDPSTQARKMNIIDKILKHAAVLCLQEVHGTEAELKQIFNKYKNTHALHYTFFHDASAGGNVTLIRFNAFPKGAVFPDPVVLATGRAITSEVILSDKSLNQCHINVLNIHNESIEDTDFDSILSWTKRSGRLASLHPEKYVVIAAGDFNFDSEDNMAVSLSSNLAKIHRSHSAQNAPALQAALASFVEVSTKTHTHYH